ncbi:MAG: dTDP-4-dehydrorhamnose reductase [Pseudomonadota bacterium]
MTLLVIGASGQMGQTLAEQISKRSIDAVVVGRPKLDILKADSIRDALTQIRPTAIINTSAYAQVDQAESDRDAAVALNDTAPRELAIEAERAGARLIHMSTDYVFDGMKGAPYAEDDSTNPLNHYGRTKRAGEIGVLEHGGVIARVSWILSPYGSNFTKTMLRLAESRKDVRVVADQFGTPTLGLPLADALLDVALSLEDMSSPPDVIHLAGQEGVVWADVAEAIFDALSARGGPNIHVERIATTERPTPSVRPKDTRLDSHRLAQLFGIVLPHWRDELPSVVDRIVSG